MREQKNAWKQGDGSQEEGFGIVANTRGYRGRHYHKMVMARL
ncbi:hypothetical protein [Asaia sp. As-1742]|nr:hypothetical protein [Asaia sp. As-1742]